MESRFIKSLNAKIAGGDFYDAHQLTRAIFDRFAKKKDIDGGLAFGAEYAEIFAEKGQYELTVNLGCRALQLLQTCNVRPTMELIDQLSVFFMLCPAFATDTKYDLMNKLILWSRDCEEAAEVEKDGLKSLHSMMAEAYLAEGKFGLCQGHMVFCEDVDSMLDMLAAWQKQGYPSECHLFTFRLVCILLTRGKMHVAGHLLQRLPVVWESQDVPAALQAAWLVWAGCQLQCHELVEFVRRKYALILRVDHAFEKLLVAIEGRVFGIQYQPSGLGGMLQSLLSGGMPMGLPAA
eukprot:Protomagalhaensia_wolfi_Nauph_80__2718@NODE_284_length_2933_cov_63_744990_g212_i0_p1_GENE_NODE_284_length_2933_cov_63_744990_g212_i0NODE_284_length_2933_cov_63_744990_g212_i0_p1_ORF_typecomplete_len292_score46_43DUF410/PF04190_13/4_7e35TPR_MalT/PF17874_1/13TPR_MalT/PF17874_1/9_1XFP/PF03894_15/0_27_NODE_284_length_2933_cov_63_744990_g212_i010891964